MKRAMTSFISKKGMNVNGEFPALPAGRHVTFKNK